MKKYLKLTLVVILVLSLIVITGCEKNPASKFKHPKTISYKTEKGTIQLTYDDDGTYEVTKSKPYVILKNKNGNFRIDMDYSNSTISQQNTTKENFKKDKHYTILDNLKFNGYKGYALVQNQFTTTNLYLTLDEKNEIISNIKVSPIITSEAIKQMNTGTKAEDVIFNQEKVQQILKTVKYKK